MLSYYCCNSGTLYVQVMTNYNVRTSREGNNDPALPPFMALMSIYGKHKTLPDFYPLSRISNPRLARLHYADRGQISVYMTLHSNLGC